MLFQMMWLCCLLLFLRFYITGGHYELEHKTQSIGPEHESRRILNGKEIFDTRPYMVYLRAAKPQSDPNWLCGGVIIHPRYILTSAACIEDVRHFYIISGTHSWVPQKDTNDCIKNGAIKAIWKCVPKSYQFDGHSFNNIHWMMNDIAVVMTAEPINFEKRVKGCDFIPQAIRFNNESEQLESAGTKASVAGWGSVDEYNDAADVPLDEDPKLPAGRAGVNSRQLMEANVLVIDKESCKSIWLDRYHDIIDQYMICGKNINHGELQLACMENQMECRELVFSAEVGGTVRRHHQESFNHRLLQSLAKVKSLKRARQKSLRREGKDVGGFCENDHGGPLVAGQGKTAVLIGIISAYRTLNHSKKCVGPFLYTSVFNNRNLINCAVNRAMGTTCRTVLRETSTVLDQESINWSEMKPMAVSNKKRSKHHGKKRKHTIPPMKLVRMKADEVITEPTPKQQQQDENTTESVSKENEGMAILFEVRRRHSLRRGGTRAAFNKRSSPNSIKKSLRLKKKIIK